MNFVWLSSLCSSHNVSPVASFILPSSLVMLNVQLDSIYYLVLKQQHESISTL